MDTGPVRLGEGGAGRIAHEASDVEISVRRLARWIEVNGWEGYDPYDVRGTPLFRALHRLSQRRTLASRIPRRVFVEVADAFPYATRAALRIRPEINPKGMGLLAHGYLTLAARTGEVEFRRRGLECLDWLLEHPSRDFPGLSWGHPFDWESAVLVPAGMPAGIVSCVAGDALYEAWKQTGDSRYLDACGEVCTFLLEGLRVDTIDRDTICFSFTPIDDFHVHNVNLVAAEFLVRVGSALGKPELVEAGVRASKYALGELEEDGRLPYWGRVQSNIAPGHVDHTHTGFQLRAFAGLFETTQDERYLEALTRHFGFYRRTLWRADKGTLVPRTTPRRDYPVDVHAVAEAVLCAARVRRLTPAAGDLLPPALALAFRMQTPEGWFVAALKRRLGREVEVKIPYIRWGQGWMLLALSSALGEQDQLRAGKGA
ncbi:MAG TPA: hypothetical protein VM184_07450 [Gaiellaceae bacterium]|nr:hypothetical protein [Gaiellaceae bacterium]